MKGPETYTNHDDGNGRPIHYGDYVVTKYERQQASGPDGEALFVPFSGMVIDVRGDEKGGGDWHHKTGHWSYGEHGRMEPAEQFVHVSSEDGFYKAYSGYELEVIPEEHDIPAKLDEKTRKATAENDEAKSLNLGDSHVGVPYAIVRSAEKFARSLVSEGKEATTDAVLLAFMESGMMLSESNLFDDGVGGKAVGWQEVLDGRP